jgi:hypothetical protein
MYRNSHHYKMLTLPLLDGARSACHHDKKYDAATLILEKYVEQKLEVSSMKPKRTVSQVPIQNINTGA